MAVPWATMQYALQAIMRPVNGAYVTRLAVIKYHLVLGPTMPAGPWPSKYACTYAVRRMSAPQLSWYGTAYHSVLPVPSLWRRQATLVLPAIVYCQ